MSLRGERRVGRWLKAQREARGWTQLYLAAKLGVGRGAVAHMEAGRRVLTFRTAVRVAAVFGFSLTPIESVWGQP